MTRETEGGLCEEAGTAGGSVRVEDRLFRVSEPRETLYQMGEGRDWMRYPVRTRQVRWTSGRKASCL